VCVLPPTHGRGSIAYMTALVALLPGSVIPTPPFPPPFIFLWSQPSCLPTKYLLVIHPFRLIRVRILYCLFPPPAGKGVPLDKLEQMYYNHTAIYAPYQSNTVISRFPIFDIRIRIFFWNEYFHPPLVSAKIPFFENESFRYLKTCSRFSSFFLTTPPREGKITQHYE